MKTVSAGSYPKPPHEGQPFALRKSIGAMERGEITEPDLRAVGDELVRELIQEQVEAGLDIVTDGHARWTDGQTPFARRIEGFRVAHEDLIRYFDSNTYYRRPHAVSKLSWKGPITVADWTFAQSVSVTPVKQVLTGPYTLAKLSKNEHYSSERDFVLDVAALLNREARALQEAGCTRVQFDEPAAVSHPNTADEPKDPALMTEAQAVLVEGLEMITELRTYFGDVGDFGKGFFALPFDVFGLDFVAGPNNWDLIKEFPGGKILCAGLLDARNTRLEPLDDLLGQVNRLAEFVSVDRLELSTSCGLEFLPRDRAQAKLKRMVEAGRAASQGGEM